MQVAKDPRVERVPCVHKGTYADDCLCERVKQHKCYIVATCDRDLRRRIRKVNGAKGGERSEGTRKEQVRKG
jgi:U3 small nucleolar RNA-associated protein 24